MAMIDRLKRSIFTTDSTKKNPDVKSWFVNSPREKNPKIRKLAVKIIVGSIMDTASPKESVRSNMSTFIINHEHMVFCIQSGMDHKKLERSIREVLLEEGVRKKKIAKVFKKEILQEYSSLESSLIS